jgi:hypothetical protein
MKYTRILFFLFCIVISCATTQNANFNAQQYWNTPPDLSKVTYEGGDGKTVESAILIKNAGNAINGIAAEYAYITKTHGEKFKDWNLLEQNSFNSGNKKYDFMKIQLILNSDTVSYYFDISEFYGKFN